MRERFNPGLYYMPSQKSKEAEVIAILHRMGIAGGGAHPGRK